MVPGPSDKFRVRVAQELTGPATLVVMTVEKVVDALPKELAKCTVDGG